MPDNLEWLHDDVRQNRKQLEREDTQIGRRNYLRSLIALYELGLSNIRERTARLLVDSFELGGEWRFHELYPLLDETPRLSNNGKLKLEPNRTPFLTLVAYTFKTYANLISFKKSVLSDNRWRAFCQSIRIRHRITHPNNYIDIDITDDELRLIDEGLAWWNDTLDELWEAHKNWMLPTRSIDGVIVPPNSGDY